MKYNRDVLHLFVVNAVIICLYVCIFPLRSMLLSIEVNVFSIEVNAFFPLRSMLFSIEASAFFH